MWTSDAHARHPRHVARDGARRHRARGRCAGTRARPGERVELSAASGAVEHLELAAPAPPCFGRWPASRRRRRGHGDDRQQRRRRRPLRWPRRTARRHARAGRRRAVRSASCSPSSTSPSGSSRDGVRRPPGRPRRGPTSARSRAGEEREYLFSATWPGARRATTSTRARPWPRGPVAGRRGRRRSRRRRPTATATPTKPKPKPTPTKPRVTPTPTPTAGEPID